MTEAIQDMSSAEEPGTSQGAAILACDRRCACNLLELSQDVGRCDGKESALRPGMLNFGRAQVIALAWRRVAAKCASTNGGICFRLRGWLLLSVCP